MASCVYAGVVVQEVQDIMRNVVFSLLLMGCVHTPVVEVPQTLPHPPKQSNVVLPQKHYMTQEDLQNEIAELGLKYNEFAQDINNLEWFYISGFFDDMRRTAQDIISRMSTVDNVEEFLFYRRLYYECTDLFNNALWWWGDKRDKMTDIRERLEDAR
jgi:hypothetical protein